MTFEELHEKIEGENPVDERTAEKLINDFIKQDETPKAQIRDEAEKIIELTGKYISKREKELIDLLNLFNNHNTPTCKNLEQTVMLFELFAESLKSFDELFEREKQVIHRKNRKEKRGKK